MKIDWYPGKSEFSLEADVLLSPYEIFNLLLNLISFFGNGGTDEKAASVILGYELAIYMTFEDFEKSDFRWFFQYNDGILRFKNNDDMFYFKLLVS